MKNILLPCFCFGWFSLCSWCAQAEPPSADQIKQWVNQLGNPQYAQREQAHKQLAAAGVTAEAELKAAVHHRDLEIRRRAAALLLAVDAARMKEVPPGWKLRWQKPRSISVNQPSIQEPWVVDGLILAQNNQQREVINLRTSEYMWSSPWTMNNYMLPQIETLPDSFISIEGQKLRCLNPHTSGVRWETNIPNVIRHWGLFGDRVVVLDQKQVQSFDAKTGKALPAHPITAQKTYPLGIAAGCAVTWGMQQNRLLVHDPDTFEPRHEIATDRPTRILSFDNHLLTLDSVGRWLAMHDLTTGQTRWKITPPARCTSSYFWLYLERRGDYLAYPGIVWSLETGKVLWEYPLPDARINSIRLPDLFTRPAPVYPVRPTLTDTTAYFPTPTGELHAVSLSTGQRQWAWRPSNSPMCRVRSVPPYLLVSTSTTLYCLESTEPMSQSSP